MGFGIFSRPADRVPFRHLIRFRCEDGINRIQEEAELFRDRGTERENRCPNGCQAHRASLFRNTTPAGCITIFACKWKAFLKSWAVPKGLPWKQGEKHLAVEVEDHPIEYEAFEGIIPKGNYGGGTVMVWDRGTYYVYGEEPLESLREGRLHLVLDGEKAKGEWALIRIRWTAARRIGCS